MKIFLLMLLIKVLLKTVLKYSKKSVLMGKLKVAANVFKKRVDWALSCSISLCRRISTRQFCSLGNNSEQWNKNTYIIVTKFCKTSIAFTKFIHSKSKISPKEAFSETKSRNQFLKRRSAALALLSLESSY